MISEDMLKAFDMLEKVRLRMREKGAAFIQIAVTCYADGGGQATVIPRSGGAAFVATWRHNEFALGVIKYETERYLTYALVD
jgi:hypothetical protein